MLAAYAPLAKLNWAIVAKIDIWEVRRPYLVAALISITVAIIIIIAGSIFFMKISNPMINALETSQARNQAIIEGAIDGIITISDRGIVESVNPAVEKLFGYTSKELIGSNINKIMPEPYHSKHDDYISNFLRTRQPKIIGIGREIPCRRKDGSIFPAYLAVNEIYVDGQTKFIGIINDLTRLKKAEREIKALSQRMIEVQEEERDRISREIHDDLGTSLFLLKMMIQGTMAKIDKEHASEEFKKGCDEVLETLGQIVESTRAMSHSLSPIGLKELGLTMAIDKLLDRVQLSKAININRDYRALDGIFEEGWSINVYRIVQEALNNISKHSDATEITLCCSNSGGKYTLSIRDNGQGISAENLRRARKKGLGLSLMKERANLVKAEFTIDSKPGEGTEVKLEFQKEE